MSIIMKDLDGGLGVLIEAKGTLTVEEFMNALTEHMSQPEEKLKKYIYSISDYTEVNYTAVTLESIKEIAQRTLEVSKLNPNVIVGICTNEDVMNLLAELWELYVEDGGWKIGLFKSREELDEWIKEEVSKKFKKYDCTFE